MNEYVIAKYIRLSLDDAKTESLSIEHQKLIIDNHIDELEIPNATILEFVDNGHTGTNMERTAVQEMLDLVRSGRVNCVAVKDFSRFSRNAMDSGYFIEQVFPLYGVRFISVSDGFDSNDYKNDTGGIDVAFKFLMNEYYSKDLSAKVRSAKRIQMTRGENIVASTIYGYRKNSGGKWEPDEKENENEVSVADIVREIFRMAKEGNSTTQIRNKLCLEKYPTPKEYIELKRGKDVDVKCVWTARMVLHIIKNIQYTGCYVSGKQESKAIGSSSKINVDESKWIVIPNSHLPIVNEEDFTIVNNIMEKYNNFQVAKPTENALLSDTSRPKRNKMISGERMTNNPIYCYSKDDCGELQIDKAVSTIIQEMFQLAKQGLSFKEIRDALTKSGYSTPSEYIKLSKGHKITPTCKWTEKCVRVMLKNIQFTGAYVAGKILKNYETGKKYHTAKCDWIIIPDKNPAIVSMELFDEVQNTLAKRTIKRKNIGTQDYLLRGGILKCGCCGYALVYDSTPKDAIYRCHHTLGVLYAECNKFKVKASELDEAVLSIIRKQANTLLNSDGLDGLKKITMDDKKISDHEKETRKFVTKRQEAYEQFVMGEIDTETYQSLKADCTAQLDRINNQIALAKQEERDKLSGVKSAAIAKQVLSETATPREIVELLIDRISVSTDDKIEINWKVADFTKFK